MLHTQVGFLVLMALLAVVLRWMGLEPEEFGLDMNGIWIEWRPKVGLASKTVLMA